VSEKNPRLHGPPVTVRVFAWNGRIYLYPSAFVEGENFAPTGKTRFGSVIIDTAKYLYASREAIELMRKVKRGRDSIGDLGWHDSNHGDAFSWFGVIFRVVDPKTCETARDFRIMAYNEIPNDVPQEIREAKVNEQTCAWRLPYACDSNPVDMLAGIASEPVAPVAPVEPVFCGPLCQSGYATDRSVGLIDGPFLLGGKHVTAARFSAETKTCAYCRAKVVA